MEPVQPGAAGGADPATIDLSPFNIEASRRKKLAKRLAELKASGRATAKALGVSKDTVRNDLKDISGEKSPPAAAKAKKNGGKAGASGEKSPPDDGMAAAMALERRAAEAARGAEKREKRSAVEERERAALKLIDIDTSVPTLKNWH